MNTETRKKIKIDDSWKALLQDEFDLEYMQALRRFLQHEKQLGKIIYPQAKQIFSALNLTPFNQVKVVIIGYY